MTDPVPGIRARDDRLGPRIHDMHLYLGLLADALRARGASRATVREVVGEVRAHCLASGQQPVEVFGRPEEYASARFRRMTTGRVVARVLLATVGALGAWLVGLALLGLVTGQTDVGLTRWALGWGAYLVVLVVVVPWTVYAAERWALGSLVDRRGVRRWAWLVRFAITTAFLLAAFFLILRHDVGGTLDGDAVLVAPWWVLLVVGTCLLPLIKQGPGDRLVPAPVPPGGQPVRTRRQRVIDWVMDRHP